MSCCMVQVSHYMLQVSRYISRHLNHEVRRMNHVARHVTPMFFLSACLPHSRSLPSNALATRIVPSINVDAATPTAVHTKSLSQAKNSFFDAACADIRDLGSTTSIAETSSSKCAPYLIPQRISLPEPGLLHLFEIP